MKIVLLACISCLMFSCTQAAGTCDAGVRPGVSPGNKNYEVDEACFRQCYATCDYRRSHIEGWAGNCQNDCEENCNRCNKYVWERLKRDPRCPPPKCMLKDEAWKACLADPKVPRGYFDRAIKILTNKGIYNKYTWQLPRNIRYFYCRCKTQDSSEDGCQYFPPVKMSRKLNSYWANRWLNNLDEGEDDQSIGDSYWANQWLNNLDEGEDDQSIGDSYWANRWLNNIDEGENDQSIGDSYWTNQWLNNIDEADDHNGVETIGSINWMTGCDRAKCPCGCEPCQSGLCKCYSWCRN